MFAAIILVSLTFSTVTSYMEERCHCNMVHHKQDQFCNSEFAMHVKIHDAVPSPLPGEMDIGPLHNKYMRYEVEVLENFKGDNEEGQITYVYSPRGGICGKPWLFISNEEDEDATNEYLFVGDIVPISDGIDYMVITNCNWVDLWDDVLEAQIDGLKGMYSDCEPTCKVFPVSGPMDIGYTDADNFAHDDCSFNPVMAEILKVPDCETMYGYCLRQSDNTCRWENTDAFEQCFQSRKTGLTVGAAAVTTKEDCKIYKGRQKKKCLMKFLKSRNNAGRK